MPFSSKKSSLYKKRINKGKIVWFSIAAANRDESGISQNPNSVYAWLPKGSNAQLLAMRGNVITIAGFMQTDNTLMAYSHEGSTTSEIFIAYVEDFIKNSPCLVKTIVIIDNASFHKSAMVKKK